eukprot:606791-Prorocentrum_minimum.AAC.1
MPRLRPYCDPVESALGSRSATKRWHMTTPDDVSSTKSTFGNSFELASLAAFSRPARPPPPLLRGYILMTDQSYAGGA